MQEHESLYSEWEARALKLLKGKPVSVLTKTALSGLKTEVLYAERPRVYAGINVKTGWDAVEVQGRVAGRFQGDSKWTSSTRGLLTRVFETDAIDEITQGRVEWLNSSLSFVSEILEHQNSFTVHLDPFAQCVIEAKPNGFEHASQLLQLLKGQKGNHPLSIDASIIGDLGGTEQEELLWVLLSILEIHESGVQDWSSIWIQLSTDANIIGSVVKFRALRQLIRGLAFELKVGLESMPYVCAEASPRMFAIADEHNNMLRTLYACVGAIWGGADGVMAHGYDALTESSDQAHRIAQNIHAILKEECGLGDWIDPLFGAYQVEQQTQALCTQVWTEFTSIANASSGGLRSFIQSGLLERLLRLRQRRNGEVSSHRHLLTGVSAYAKADEKIGTEWLDFASSLFVRTAQEMEIVRAKIEGAGGISVQVLGLGDGNSYKARWEFLVQMLASVGMHPEMVSNVESFTSDVRCVIGTDDQYGTQLAELVPALEENFMGPIWIVGSVPGHIHTDRAIPIVNGMDRIQFFNGLISTMTRDKGGVQ